MPDYGLQLHMGTKIVLFGEMSSGLMKQKYNYSKIHQKYCGKLVEGYLKRLTQVKQFKGNATKY